MCSEMTHRRIKSDPILFLACKPVGMNTHKGRPISLCRDCPRCGSTLTLPIAKLEEMYPLTAYALEIR